MQLIAEYRQVFVDAKVWFLDMSQLFEVPVGHISEDEDCSTVSSNSHVARSIWMSLSLAVSLVAFPLSNKNNP